MYATQRRKLAFILVAAAAAAAKTESLAIIQTCPATAKERDLKSSANYTHWTFGHSVIHCRQFYTRFERQSSLVTSHTGAAAAAALLGVVVVVASAVKCIYLTADRRTCVN